MSPRLKLIQLDHYETNNLVRKVYARYFVSRENCDTQRVSHRRVVCYPVSRENNLQTNSQVVANSLKGGLSVEQGVDTVSMCNLEALMGF